MTEMFGEAWSPMSVPDLAPDDDDDCVWSFSDTLSKSGDLPARMQEFSKI